MSFFIFSLLILLHFPPLYFSLYFYPFWFKNQQPKIATRIIRCSLTKSMVWGGLDVRRPYLYLHKGRGAASKRPQTQEKHF